MTGIGLLILVGLSCLLFPCKGAITSPPDKKNYLFLPGKTAKIKWEFDDAISGLTARSWTFTSNDGSLTDRLATIIRNGSTDIESKLFDVDIERPATLVLRNVNQSYTGTYQFGIISSKTFSSEVKVSIRKKPTAKVGCLSRNEVNEGGNFTCECSSEGGIPPANVTWFKNGVDISETRKKNITLTRNDVGAADGGTYTCVAQNYPSEAFKEEKSIELIVRLNSKPNNTNITFEPNPATVGNQVEIRCDSEAVPEPNFFIMRNGESVSAEKTYTISEVKQSDEGPYTCIAVNILGNDSAADNLTVIGPITPTRTISTPTTSYAATSSITSKRPGPTPTPTPPPPPPIGLIIGIIVGVLVLIIIVVVVVHCYKSKQKERGNRANIDPVPGNHYELENEEPGPGDGAYDTVGPVGASSSKSKPPAGNTLPPVYAAVDKNNRQGNTLYASLDNDALQSSRASKKEPDRPPQTEYAHIDFKKSAPKADLV